MSSIEFNNYYLLSFLYGKTLRIYTTTGEGGINENFAFYDVKDYQIINKDNLSIYIFYININNELRLKTFNIFTHTINEIELPTIFASSLAVYKSYDYYNVLITQFGFLYSAVFQNEELSNFTKLNIKAISVYAETNSAGAIIEDRYNNAKIVTFLYDGSKFNFSNSYFINKGKYYHLTKIDSDYKVTYYDGINNKFLIVGSRKEAGVNGNYEEVVDVGYAKITRIRDVLKEELYSE